MVACIEANPTAPVKCKVVEVVVDVGLSLAAWMFRLKHSCLFLVRLLSAFG